MNAGKSSFVPSYDPDRPGVDIKPYAMVHPTAKIGPGTTIWSSANVGAYVSIGRDCVVGANAYIGAHSVLGDGTRVQTGVFLPNGTMVGKRVFIGPLAHATDDRHPVAGNTGYKAEPPVIHDDVSIGAGPTLLPGITLGNGCVIGAGSVVTKDVQANATVVGNPARPIQELRQREAVLRRLVWMFDALLKEWDRGG